MNKFDIEFYNGLMKGIVKCAGIVKKSADMKEANEQIDDLLKKIQNLYKPLFLQSRKFDLIVGNPPWLSYRYIKNVEYQKFIKESILNVHRLLPQKKAELMTQMELATLFFARVSELYLSKKGKISFVMPRSVFVSDQHDVFRKCNFVPEM